MQLSNLAVNQHKGPQRKKKTLFCYVQHLRTMSADNNVDAASEVTSPKKTIRTSETDDTSKRLPSLRSDRERPSPGPNRKVSGSGAVRQPAGPDGPNVDVFQSGGNTADTGILALGTIRGSPAKTGRLLRSQSTSPTPSRRTHGLDTGHHATDVETSDLEDGQIAECKCADPAKCTKP
jgi:hypothetical protein